MQNLFFLKQHLSFGKNDKWPLFFSVRFHHYFQHLFVSVENINMVSEHCHKHYLQIWIFFGFTIFEFTTMRKKLYQCLFHFFLLLFIRIVHHHHQQQKKNNFYENISTEYICEKCVNMKNDFFFHNLVCPPK